MADFDLNAEIAKTGKDATFKQRAVYAISGGVAAAAPCYYYHMLGDLPAESFFVLFAVVAVLSAAALSFSYHNSAQKLRVQVISKPGYAISKKDVIVPQGEKVSDVMARLEEKQSSVTLVEVTAYTIFYTNLTFMFLFCFFAFFFFRRLAPAMNFIVSTLGSAAAIWVNSNL